MKTAQLLWEFIKQFKWSYIIGIIVLFITSFISSMIPKIMGYVTDSINDRMPASVTNKYLLILVAATVAVFILRFTWRYFLVGSNRYLECYLREKLFAHMQTLPVSFYDNNKTGDLIAYAINDIQAIRRVFGFGLTSILDGLVVNTISIIIMVRTINPVLTLMAIAPAPIIVMVIYLLRKKIRERFGAVQKAFAQISGKVQENISGIRVIKAFAQEEEEVQDFLRYNQARVDTQMSLTRVSAVLGPVTQLAFGISTVLFIIYGSGLVAKGIISLGDYVAFSSYIMVIMGPIVSIGRIIEVWQRGLASIQRLDRIFCHRSEKDAENALATVSLFGLNDRSDDDLPAIERLKGDIVIKDLTFAYPGTDKKVLQDINLEIKEGQTLGILGKTGSGKTTLVNLLLRLYEVEDGHIFIGGRDINHIPLKVLRENIGYAPQDNFLFSTTIKSNIEFFKPVYDDGQIEQAARLAGIYDEIMSFPDGFDTVVGERGVTLSGGQKQRVSIARAIVKDPAILILDDSLSAVDTKTEQKILENLKNVLKGRTGIVISHRVSVVRYCDQIIFMDEGRIIERGTHEELMRLKGAYYNLYISQMEQVEDNLLCARG
ncbi:ATP-binding cassette subfamily B protein [Caldicoprobacter guelmensis]|uniref:ABC transporter ATP-binding protein n=1 Tax=Caldicoprobacter guelmensis TaxID=1170224 RepID=UPI0019587D49|nr:ABC transporter ATP-binding protein [Caldicoprobacter guelmensis]MBM7583320.1 ATP-binding cassette subfamily B protein [Caldicoprobacter guelmensis]